MMHDFFRALSILTSFYSYASIVCHLYIIVHIFSFLNFIIWKDICTHEFIVDLLCYRPIVDILEGIRIHATTFLRT